MSSWQAEEESCAQALTFFFRLPNGKDNLGNFVINNQISRGVFSHYDLKGGKDFRFVRFCRVLKKQKKTN